MNNMWNKFITFEGPECAGKTTQIKFLKDFLIQRGEQVVVAREPGGTQIGEELRKIVKYHQNSVVTDKTELLLFAASRAQLVVETIIPALKNNSFVICDRFIDSTVAYQGYARSLDNNFVKQLNAFVVGKCIPKYTFLLDLNTEESQRRADLRNQAKRDQDRIESESENFHKKVRNGFLKIASDNPNRIKVINASNNPENIHNTILRYLGFNS